MDKDFQSISDNLEKVIEMAFIDDILDSEDTAGMVSFAGEGWGEGVQSSQGWDEGDE